MENKADVKSIMARFQTGGAGNDGDSVAPAGRPKPPVHSTLSSRPPMPIKKPILESLSGNAINNSPKPTHVRNTVSPEPKKNKAFASRFIDTQDNVKPSMVPKQPKPPPSQPPDPVQKPPPKKLPLTSTLSDSKPAFPKPPAPTSKPTWVKDDNDECASSQPKIPQQKPNSNLMKIWQQNEEKAVANTSNRSSPPPISAAKPTSNFKTAQTMFNKEKDNEQTDGGGANKRPLVATNSLPPPKPPASKKPSFRGHAKTFSQPMGETDDVAPGGPKRNPLPNPLTLGPPPAKPNRPPRVQLEKFKRGAETTDDGPGTLKKSIAAAPQSSYQSNHGNHMVPPPLPQTALPSLPPRHPGSMIQQEDFYDDVDELDVPPPLPSPSAHPSQRSEDLDDSDGDMYDDLDERWEEAEQEKKDKESKEAKRRVEAEKKEQKEREKKERDARKKFKLVGPLQVVQQGKACMACKGGKTDLTLKEGDSLDIIRVQGNPEGKWLGRMLDGSIGYVKTTAVEIDFNSLKSQAQQEYDPEVYDDIDVSSSENSGGHKGPGVVLPPLPGEDGEIYDDVLDPNPEVSPPKSRSVPMKSNSFLRMFERPGRPTSTKVVPPPIQFNAQANTVDPAEDDEIYDDVDAQNAPPPLPMSSFPILKGKIRAEDTDMKKQKKFEKEEKDFRKKFKYDGEIQVLYQVTIVHNLTNKRWSGKELPVRAGEKLDVIVTAVDNKLICRNEDGKFGHVSTSHIVTDDVDIYDDIGDDCIYDND